MTEQPERSDENTPEESNASPPAAGHLFSLPCPTDDAAFKDILAQSDTQTIAQYASQAPEKRQRELAFERLKPVIQSIADKVARRFDAPMVLHDLADESISIIGRLVLDKDKYDPKHGSFQSWCVVVLTNRARSLLRKARSENKQWRKYATSKFPRQPFSRKPIDDPDSGQSTAALFAEQDPEESEISHPGAGAASSGIDEAELDSLWAWLKDLRETLTKNAWNVRRGVNYFAVLLVLLRLSLARLCKDAVEHVARVDLIEKFLPWCVNEENMSFHPGWPTLAVIWDGCRPALDAPPNFLDGNTFCDIVNNLPPPETRLNQALWNQWCKRAKEKARKQLNNPELWDRLFARLLPDRI